MSGQRLSSASKSLEDTFNDPSLHDSFFQITNKLRSAGILTDITLVANGHNFPVHKIILVASSEYFMTMFSGSMVPSEERVYMHGINEETMETILTYIYTSYVLITEENVEDLLDASSQFLLYSLQNRCAKFLKDRLDDENCLQIFCLANRFTLPSLKEASLKYIAANYLLNEYSTFIYI